MQPVDLQRLIQIIVEEVAAAQSAPAPSRCACHSLLYECCPDRLRGVLDAGETRLGVHQCGGAPSRPAPTPCPGESLLYECCPDRLRGVLDAGATRLGLHASGGAPGDVASMIDHTLLKPDATRREIEALCREAAEYRFASVCVNPTWVALCASLLQ